MLLRKNKSGNEAEKKNLRCLLISNAELCLYQDSALWDPVGKKGTYWSAFERGEEKPIEEKGHPAQKARP